MSDQDEPFIIIDGEPEPLSTHPDDEFKIDKLKIDQYTALRRGAIRSRTWWLVAFFLASVFTLDMILRAIIEFYQAHLLLWPAIRISAAIPAILFALHAQTRARQFASEIEKSALPEPTTPPDFSTLGNGEERWKHLENIR